MYLCTFMYLFFNVSAWYLKPLNIKWDPTAFLRNRLLLTLGDYMNNEQQYFYSIYSSMLISTFTNAFFLI